MLIIPNFFFLNFAAPKLTNDNVKTSNWIKFPQNFHAMQRKDTEWRKKRKLTFRFLFRSKFNESKKREHSPKRNSTFFWVAFFLLQSPRKHLTKA